MQGTEIPTALPVATPAELRVRTVPMSSDREHRISAWPLETPPLRFDVVSLDHWLDLNA